MNVPTDSTATATDSVTTEGERPTTTKRGGDGTTTTMRGAGGGGSGPLSGLPGSAVPWLGLLAVLGGTGGYLYRRYRRERDRNEE